MDKQTIKFIGDVIIIEKTIKSEVNQIKETVANYLNLVRKIENYAEKKDYRIKGANDNFFLETVQPWDNHLDATFHLYSCNDWSEKDIYDTVTLCINYEDLI